MKSKLFTLALVVGQLVILALAWREAELPRTDFPAFWASTRLWQMGENPYDREALCRVEATVRDAGLGCLLNNHPPVLLPLVSAVSDENFTASYWRWAAVLVFVSLLCLVPLYYISGDIKAAALCLLFPALYAGITLAQDTPFLLLAVLVWVWQMDGRRDFIAGLALSLSCVKPQYAVILGVPLLFSRPRAFMGFCVGGAGLVGFSFALVGVEGFKGLLDIVRLSAEGSVFGIYQERQYNVTGLLVRSGFSPFWAWPVFAAGIAAVSLLWRKYGTSLPALSIGIIFALFTAPHAHFHDLSLLMPALAAHRLAPVVASLWVLVSLGLDLQFVGGYSLMLALTYFQWKKLGTGIR